MTPAVKVALSKFVEELLAKNWIQVSSSEWVSSIFVVPKEVPITRMIESRAEMIRSENLGASVCWVIDYLQINAQTEVLKIPFQELATSLIK